MLLLATKVVSRGRISICMFALIAALSYLLMCLFPFVVNATKTKTVDLDECFKSLLFF